MLLGDAKSITFQYTHAKTLKTFFSGPISPIYKNSTVSEPWECLLYLELSPTSMKKSKNLISPAAPVTL